MVFGTLDGRLERALRFVLCLGALAAVSAPSLARDVRIEHVTLISPERASPLRDATVDIRDERIVAVSGAAARKAATGAEIINGTGLFLTPGLIDSHTHLSEVPGMLPTHQQAHPEIAKASREQSPRSYLHFGVTTVLDLGTTRDRIAEWNAKDVRPDALFCGSAPVLDGYPSHFTPKPARYQEYPYFVVQPGETPPAGADAAAHTPEAVVKRMKADGAICVKTYFERGFGADRNLPVPTLDTTKALVRAAHAAGLLVFIHANSSEAQEFALEAGADIFAHGLWNWREPGGASELTPDVKKILDGVVAGKRGSQTTVQVLNGERDLFDPHYLDDPMMARVVPAKLLEWYRTPEGQWFHDVLAQNMLPRKDGAPSTPEAQWNAMRGSYAGILARVQNAAGYLAQRNARLLFGTDTPSGPTYANQPGLNGFMEMHRLQEAGLTPAQIFRAATLVNAQAIRREKEIGTVEPGKRANLLLLRSDPTQTIEAYSSIAKVVSRGRVLDAAELAANAQRNR